MSELPRIDRLAIAIADKRMSRRGVMKGGLATAAATSLLPRPGLAQEATPEAASDESGFGQEFLFVQTFTGGTFAANPAAGTPFAAGTPEAGVHGTYMLSLGGHPGQTVYFSDRPERIVGDGPTDQFVDGLGFGSGDPPNAALVTENADGQTVVVVLELMDPVVDIDAGTVAYEANLLDDYVGDGLDHLLEQGRADAVPEEFGAASLFIDDCSKKEVICLANNSDDCDDQVGSGSIGTCWSWSSFGCVFCNSPSAWCNDNISACDDDCAGYHSWACTGAA